MKDLSDKFYLTVTYDSRQLIENVVSSLKKDGVEKQPIIGYCNVDYCFTFYRGDSIKDLKNKLLEYGPQNIIAILVPDSIFNGRTYKDVRYPDGLVKRLTQGSDEEGTLNVGSCRFYNLETLKEIGIEIQRKRTLPKIFLDFLSNLPIMY